MKYGLHQKAIDHLRRVFELDPGNIEARERLKDIFVSQGRDEEAVAELMLLAEQAGMSDRLQAEVYVREILAIDGTHQPALDGFGFDDHDQFECGVPEPGEASPEQSVGTFHEGPWALLFEHTELLAKRDVVECDVEAGRGESEQEVEHQERPSKDRDQ